MGGGFGGFPLFSPSSWRGFGRDFHVFPPVGWGSPIYIHSPLLSLYTAILFLKVSVKSLILILPLIISRFSGEASCRAVCIEPGDKQLYLGGVHVFHVIPTISLRIV